MTIPISAAGIGTYPQQLSTCVNILRALAAVAAAKELDADSSAYKVALASHRFFEFNKMIWWPEG